MGRFPAARGRFQAPKAVTAEGRVPAGEASEKAAKGEQAQGAKTRAEEFRSCVAGSGAPAEKEAVEHVTKVPGAPRPGNGLVPVGDYLRAGRPSVAAPMNSAQAVAPMTRTAPAVTLLSRTGTTPGKPSATVTRASPPLYVLLRQRAASGKSYATSTQSPPLPSLWLLLRQRALLRTYSRIV